MIHGTVDFNCYDENECEWTMATPIPAIANLLKTSSSLKRVSLVLFCWLSGSTKIFPSSANWTPLVRLFTESSVSSWILHIRSIEKLDGILTSLTNCAELMKLVDKGALVITNKSLVAVKRVRELVRELEVM